MKKVFITLIALIVLGTSNYAQQQTTQTERMQWWRDARFGMFIHWGLYAIPAGEWNGKEVPGIGEWIMKHAEIPAAEYRLLAKQFNPVKFNPKEWVRIAKSTGMKYIVITSKHHDGFAMFKSNVSPYNIVDATPYGKDVIKALADECHKQGIKICFYYSQSRDWNEPNGLDNDWDFKKERNFQQYLDEKVKPQLTEILTNYGAVGLIWFDTPLTISKEQAQQLKDHVRKLQPECIISGRLGGGVETDYGSTGDNVVPATVRNKDWEVPATLNNTWGFKKNDHAWKSAEDLTRLLFDIVSKGGNYLLNVGPDAEGEIPVASINILNKVGEWMKVNGEAIYATQPSPYTAEFSWGNITRKAGKLYLGIFDWPKEPFFLEGLKSKVKKAYLLSDPEKKIVFKDLYNKNYRHHRLQLYLPAEVPDKVLSVVVLEIEGDAEVEQFITQQVSEKIVLPGVLAKATNEGKDVKINFNGRGGGADRWIENGTQLVWNFTIEKPGNFKIDLVTTEAGKHDSLMWQGNHEIRLLVNGIEKQIKIVADWKEKNPRNIYWKKIHTNAGVIAFKKPGIYTITMLAEKVIPDNTAGFTFRELNLLPVK